uniref:non-specific protein-tyrosine kinase n=1 Tax=Strigamia maritima TaxID=126957 RepID=T1IYC0_STRMM
MDESDGIDGNNSPFSTMSSSDLEKVEKSTLKVHLPNGGFNIVKFGDATDVRGIIHLITSRPPVGVRAFESLYAMRLCHRNSKEEHWLHIDTTMYQVHEKYESRHPQDEWRLENSLVLVLGGLMYELRIRYFPHNLHKLYEKDKFTFYYLYDQIKCDYLKTDVNNVDPEIAVQLCCIEIRRFFKDMPIIALDKKSNFEYLEKEIGLHKFLPQSVLASMKPKTLRKSIQHHFKKFANLSEIECMFYFVDLLDSVKKCNQETFKCALGSGWSIPVELVVGPETGISYLTDKSSTQPTILANFRQVQSIQTLINETEPTKAVLQMKIAGASEVLTITCPNLTIAESMADLIDGYCRIANDTETSFWNAHPPKYRRSSSRSKSGSASPNGSKTTEDYAEIVDDEGDYSTPATKDYELIRSRLELGEIIGEGQFGDVHKGRYRCKDNQMAAVAVKTCKIESEQSMGEKFLEEA